MSGEAEKLPEPKPRERPILFNGDMVRAILSGQKTQTRRVVKAQPADVERHGSYIDSYCSERKTPENPRGMSDWFTYWLKDNRQGRDVGRCPYGKPGDLLWVRETFAFVHHSQNYESGGDDCFFRWREDEHGPMGPDALQRCPRMGGDAAALFYRADGEDENPAELHPWTDLSGKVTHAQEIPWRPSIHMPRWASRLSLRVTDVRVERVQSISERDAGAEGCEPRDTQGAERAMRAIQRPRMVCL